MPNKKANHKKILKQVGTLDFNNSIANKKFFDKILVNYSKLKYNKNKIQKQIKKNKIFIDKFYINDLAIQFECHYIKTNSYNFIYKVNNSITATNKNITTYKHIVELYTQIMARIAKFINVIQPSKVSYGLYLYKKMPNLRLLLSFIPIMISVIKIENPEFCFVRNEELLKVNKSLNKIRFIFKLFH